MTLRTRIKICGLTREADLDTAAECGADAVGFVLYDKSPRAVSVARAAELAQRLPNQLRGGVDEQPHGRHERGQATRQARSMLD